MSLIFGYEGSLQERMDKNHIDRVSPGEPNYPDGNKLFCKMFDPDMKCLDKQYEPGQTYTETGLDICKAGMMHFCENFSDCMDYYPPIVCDVNGTIQPNVFAFVKPAGVIVNDRNKFATNQLTIVKRLDYNEVIDSVINAADPEHVVSIDPNHNSIVYNGTYALNKTDSYPATIFEHGFNTKLFSRGDCLNIYSHGYKFTLMAEGEYINLVVSGDDPDVIIVGRQVDVTILGKFAKVIVKGNNNYITMDGEKGCVLMHGVRNTVICRGNADHTMVRSNNPFHMISCSGSYVSGRKILEGDTWHEIDRNNSQEKQSS